MRKRDLRNKSNLFLAAIVSLLLFTPLTAFSYTKQLDDQLVGIANSGVMLTGSDGSTSAEVFRSELIDYAADSNSTISVHVQDPTLDRDTRYIYVAPGNKGAAAQRWLSQGRKSFVTGQRYSFAHIEQLNNLDARGMYLIQGGDKAGIGFLEFAEGLGFQGSVMTGYWLESWLANSSLSTVLLSLLLIFSLAFSYVIAESRKVGICRLWGKSAREVLLLDLSENRLATSLIAVLSVAITLLVLAVYNGFAQFGLFALCYLVILGGGIAAGLAGYFLGLVVLRASPLITAIKGEMPHGLIAGGIFCIRAVSLLAGAGILASGISLLYESQRLANEEDAWARHTDAVAVGIATGTGQDYVQVAPMLRRLDESGGMFLSDPFWRLPEKRSDASTILVNSTFAREEAGIPATQLPARPNGAVIFAPEDATGAQLRRIEEGLNAEAELAQVGQISVEVQRYQTPKSVFTYATGFGLYPPPSIVPNPTLVVLGPGMTVLSDRNLASKLTSNTLLFKNSEVADSVVLDPASRQWFAAAYPVATNWMESRVQTTQQATTRVLNLSIAMLLITGAAVGTAMNYRARNSQRLRVEYLVGRNPWMSRLGLYAIEVAFFGAVVGWLVLRHSSLTAAAAFNTPNSFQVLRTLEAYPAITLSALACAITWAFVSVVISLR